jgi:hypothetical protein
MPGTNTGETLSITDSMPSTSQTRFDQISPPILEGGDSGRSTGTAATIADEAVRLFGERVYLALRTSYSSSTTWNRTSRAFQRFQRTLLVKQRRTDMLVQHPTFRFEGTAARRKFMMIKQASSLSAITAAAIAAVVLLATGSATSAQEQIVESPWSNSTAGRHQDQWKNLSINSTIPVEKSNQEIIKDDEMVDRIHREFAQRRKDYCDSHPFLSFRVGCQQDDKQ